MEGEGTETEARRREERDERDIHVIGGSRVVQTMGIFNHSKSPFRLICTFVHLSISQSVHQSTSHIRQLGATPHPGRLSPLIFPTQNLPFSVLCQRNRHTHTHVINPYYKTTPNRFSHPDCRPASAPVPAQTSPALALVPAPPSAES